MFAYCLCNPVNSLDPGGNLSIASCHGDKNPLSKYFLDFGSGGCGGGIIDIYLGQTLLETFSDIVTHFNQLFQSRSDKIDWEAGDRNHILKGTKGKHISGWKRFGIDPENKGGNDWLLVLTILQETVDDADAFFSKVLDNGATVTFYFKIYIQEQLVVMVKIWENVEGTVQKISDAIPYIFG